MSKLLLDSKAVALLVAAVAIETAPVAALAAALSVAWVMYRTLAKKGGEA